MITPTKMYLFKLHLMKNLIKIFCACFLSSVFLSCDPCYGNRGVCAEQFFFKIVNKLTRQDLVFGTSPVYQRDSVYLLTTLTGYPGRMSFYDSTKFMSTLLIPVDTFFLRFSSTDSDTLIMNYDFVKQKCCFNPRGFGRVNGISYNGISAAKTAGVFVFEK